MALLDKTRSGNKTRHLFVSLICVFLQYCSPSTIPRLFPAEARDENLPSSRVLLLIHSNWNKMQLSSSFIQTCNPQRLQAYHSTPCFILMLADTVRNCLLGHLTLKHHDTADKKVLEERVLGRGSIFSYLCLELLCYSNTVVSSL